MPSPIDLDQRLRSAAGEPDDTERAFGEVMDRIRRRARRRVLTVATIVVVMGVAGALIGVRAAERDGTDHSSVLVGRPPGTSPSSDPAEPRLRRLWSAPGVGMGPGVLPSSGRLAVAAGDMIVTAEGFGPDRGRITALDRGSGEVRWAVTLDGPAFLQGGAGGIVIANAQHDQVVGLDASDGTVRWEISLSAIGLEGYGAVTSAVTEPLSAIGLSANSEGDVRPPVVLGINTSTGAVDWRTSLVPGTDLMWGTPPIDDGETVFLSTLSHPGSAKENVAHLLGLADGSVRWVAGMGGAQGFSFVPAVIDGPYVHLPAQSGVLTVDRTDGRRRWSLPGRQAALVGSRLWILAGDGSLAEVEPGTGDLGRTVDSPIEAPAYLLDLGGDQIGVLDLEELAVIDAEGSLRLRQDWPAGLVDVPLVDRGMLVVATDDRGVTAYATPVGPDVPTTSTTAANDSRCRPLAGDEPTVENYRLTAIPAGFAPDGPVQHSKTGDVDAGGESRAVLRFVDGSGRRIEFVSFGSFDPTSFLTGAFEGAPTRIVSYPRCFGSPSQPTVSEAQAELSVTEERSMLGAQESEYGGFLIVGGPGVSTDELLVVASGLR